MKRQPITSSEPSSEASTEPSSEASTEPLVKQVQSLPAKQVLSLLAKIQVQRANEPAVDTLAAGDLIINEIQKNPCVLGDDADGDGNPDCTLEDEILGEWFEVLQPPDKESTSKD